MFACSHEFGISPAWPFWLITVIAGDNSSAFFKRIYDGVLSWPVALLWCSSFKSFVIPLLMVILHALLGLFGYAAAESFVFKYED